MNSTAFFNHIRTKLFKGSLSQAQVSNINLLIAESKKYSILDARHVAYVLATVFHETAHTMEPIEEYGKGAKYPYGKKMKMGKGPNQRIPYTLPDELYYGRGHVQVTWFENYERLTTANLKGWNFLHNPRLLLQPEPSAWASLYAMHVGLFTGRKLTDYITPTSTDFINARRIINGTDKASLIADYAVEFHKGLTLL